MNTQHPVEHDVVLVGGGHAHVEVMRKFAMRRPKGVRLTVISREIETPYSGMLPGFLAGHYSLEECHVDLVPLSLAAGSRLYQSNVTGLDLENNRVICSDRPSVSFDTLSIDIGSTPTLAGIKGHEHALPIKPIHTFLKRWGEIEPELLDLDREIRVAVVGGGAGGIEVSLCLHHRLSAALEKSKRSQPVAIHVVTDQRDILVNHSTAVRNRLMAALRRKNIRIHCNQAIENIHPDAVQGSEDLYLEADVMVLATHASAPDWLQQTGLALDASGFIRVNERLQSVSHSQVFAAGDIASHDPPLVKNGVYAVRQGPVLAGTLSDIRRNAQATVFRPQKRTLALISTGERHAIASYGPFAIEGKRIWRIKDWIDRRWMEKYRPAAMPSMDDVNTMRCGGCGAKVPADILTDVLADFRDDAADDVLIGLQNPDDAAVVRPPDGTVTVQTIDQFRSFIDDPYVFGRIASNHALSDVYAMGATPSIALATVTLPFAKEDKMAEDLRQILAGARATLHEADVRLVGGHTGEGQELSFGLSVTGYADEHALLKKSGLRVGDALILTKPLGTGVLLAGWMQAKATFDLVQAAIGTMIFSNRDAARVFLDHGASACTDVTGFGLIGHLGEMVEASGVHAVIDPEKIPVLPGAHDMLGNGIRSTLHLGNRLAAVRFVTDTSQLDHIEILMDPQTSGGLLAGVAPQQSDAVITALRAAGISSAMVIGHVAEGTRGRISIQRD